jgi:hypothetical protein
VTGFGVAADFKTNAEVVQLLRQTEVVVAVFMQILNSDVVKNNNKVFCRILLHAGLMRRSGTVFRRVRKITKNDYWLRRFSLSVCPSEWNNSPPSGRISMKFDS